MPQSGPLREGPHARYYNRHHRTRNGISAIYSDLESATRGQWSHVDGTAWIALDETLGTQESSRADLACVLAEADATRMPLPDGCLDLITIAYGFRNLANYRRAAQEFTRLLAPGGCLAILEFSTPTSRIWRGLFETYFRHVLPRLGNAISGSGGAYSYLQESVQRFPEPEEVRSLLVDAGFPRVETRSLSGGVSVLYLAYG